MILSDNVCGVFCAIQRTLLAFNEQKSYFSVYLWEELMKLFTVSLLFGAHLKILLEHLHALLK